MRAGMNMSMLRCISHSGLTSVLVTLSIGQCASLLCTDALSCPAHSSRCTTGQGSKQGSKTTWSAGKQGHSQRGASPGWDQLAHQQVGHLLRIWLQDIAAMQDAVYKT